VAAVALGALELPVVAARTGSLPLAYFVSTIALASVTAVAAAAIVGLLTVVDRIWLARQPVRGALAETTRGAAWGGVLGLGGVLVLEPWEIYDPYRLDLVLWIAFVVAGAAVGWTLVRGRARWAHGLLATAALLAWTADAFVQRHHFARLHDVAAYVALTAAGVLAWCTYRRWSSRRATGTLAVLAVLANAIALGDVRALATTGVFHGVVQPKLLRVARGLADLDRDGFSAIIGGGDCHDLDPEIHPGRCEVPGNARDDNCNGLTDPPVPPPVPSRWADGAGPRPDVYVLIVDTLRADYGGQARPPAFERLAASAWDFSVAYTAYPSTYRGLLAFAQGRPWRFVGHDRPNLLTILQAAGWDVALWHAEHRVHADSGLHLLADAPHTAEHFAMNKDRKGEMTEGIVDEAIEQMADVDGPPRARWLHFDDPHYPWTRGAATDRPQIRYLAELAHVDTQLARLLDALEATPRGRAAVVVLLGDHGEEFQEHGGTLHGGTLYEEVTRVPLLLRLPGETPRRIDEVASTLDVLPTLLHHLRLPDPGGLTGHDWRSGTTPAGPRVLSEIERRPGTLSVAHRATMHMIRDGRHKLILDVDRNVYQLFDVHADPAERSAVTHHHPKVVQRLLAELARWQDGPDCRPPVTVADAP
jgi:hypothetical protein